MRFSVPQPRLKRGPAKGGSKIAKPGLGAASRRMLRLVLGLMSCLLVAGVGFGYLYYDRTLCAVCGDPIGFGQAYDEPEFGDIYHTWHTKIPRCAYCGRILSESSSGGAGVWKGKDVRVCGSCNAQAVVDWGKAKAIGEAVRYRMAKDGLSFGRRAVPISLVDELTLTRLERTSGGSDGALQGLTVHQEGTGDAPTEVYVLSGMPLARCRWIVAHELMHAYLFEHGFRAHAPVLEEGAAEYMAYRMLSGQPGLEERRAVRLALENDDPVYGEGLRRAIAYAKRHGFTGFMGLLAASSDFPAR